MTKRKPPATVAAPSQTPTEVLLPFAFDRICADCGTLGNPNATFCRECGGIMVDELCLDCGQPLYGPEHVHSKPELCLVCRAPLFTAELLHGPEPVVLT